MSEEKLLFFCYYHAMNIHDDSRQIQPGDVFLAMPGLTVDGRQFMQQALSRGASKIFYEAAGIEQFTLPTTSIPLIPVSDLCAKQGEIVAEFYGWPSRELNMIGVTGTNGKTSVTYFLAECLKDAAVLGTTGYGRLNKITQLDYTTPMAAELQAILKTLYEDGVKHVAMEVSSHALAQHRVVGVDFDIAVFTNLSHDHLDFHGDMDTYARAKQLLFEWPTLSYAVINQDDACGRKFIEHVKSSYPVMTYSLDQPADIRLQSAKIFAQGFDCLIQTPWGLLSCRIPLLGRFNLSNCLAVIGVLGVMGVTLDAMAMQLAQLVAPPGRMQWYHMPGKPAVVVDFAHTPDALEQSLIALREHTEGKLYTVFGCGGDRDPSKREPMGRIASQHSDYVIVTNDNPRHESPRAIADTICGGISKDRLLGVELDRQLAIAMAIAQAQPDDVILVAGKGHEPYQIIGDEVIAFNDGEVVKMQLGIKDTK